MFNPTELQQIRTLTEAGKTQAEIADALGIPLATLRHRLNQSGYRFDIVRTIVAINPVKIASTRNESVTTQQTKSPETAPTVSGQLARVRKP